MQAIGHAGGIVSGAGRDILAQREGQQPEILKDDREDVHVLVVAVLPDVDSIQQDDSLGGVVQAAEQLDEGRFAAAVHPHHGQPPADLELHVQVAQGVLRAAGVAEGDIPELHRILAVAPLFGSQAALIHVVGQVEVIEDVFHIDAVDLHLGQHVYKGDNALEQVGGRTEVLRHGIQTERPAAGLEADEEIDQPHQQRRHRRGGRAEDSHRSPAQPREGIPQTHHIAADDILVLVVHPQVGGVLRLFRQGELDMEHPVAQLSGLLQQRHIFGRLPREHGRQAGGADHHGPERRQKQRVPQKGQPPIRHRRGEQPPAEHHAAQDLEQCRGDLFHQQNADRAARTR